MGRGTLTEVQDGFVTLPKVRDGSGDERVGPFEGPRWVGRSFGRSETGRRTLPVVWDELGTIPEV